MEHVRSNGPRGNGAETPGWAREMSAEMRAALRRGEERDARHDAQMAEFARRAEEDRKRADQTAERYHAETVAALQGAARVGKLIRQDIHGLTQSIDHLARAMRGRSNGQGGGNGRRFKA